MLAIYSRISKDRPNQKSIKEQKLLGEEFAEKKNFDFKHYVDQGISGGKSIQDRPALNALVDDINDDLINAVYIYNQDRLERDETTWFTLVSLFIEKNIELYEDGYLVDLDDDNIDMLRKIKSIFNSSYRKRGGKNIKRVLARNASENKGHGTLPFGYTTDENSYIIIDKDRVETVKRIFELSLSGVGVDTIAGILHNDKIETARGSKWVGASVLWIIKNPIYKGKRYFGGEYYDCPPILPPEYWQKVNDNLEKNKIHSGKPTQHKYLLNKGILRCGKCGKGYYPSKRKNLKYSYYKCATQGKYDYCKNGQVPMPLLEDFVWNRFFKGDELLVLLKENLDKGHDTKKLGELKADRKKLENKLTKLANEKKQARTALVKEIFDEDEFKEEKNRIENEVENIQLEISRLNEELFQFDKAEERLQTVGEDINELRKLKDKVPFNTQKELIKKYIKKITINSYKAKFDNKRTFMLMVEFNLPILPEVYKGNKKDGMTHLPMLHGHKETVEVNGVEYITKFDIDPTHPSNMTPEDQEKYIAKRQEEMKKNHR